MNLSVEEKLRFEADIAKRALEITPLPSSVIELTRLVNGAPDGEVDVVAVADVLNLDQGLLGKVLAEANSASHASRRTIGTAADAVLRLGVLRIVTLAISDSTTELFEPPVPAYNLGKGDLTAYAQLSSLAAVQLRRATRNALPGEVVTASLLHDIGKVVMAPALDEASVISLTKARAVIGDWSEAENEILGVEHGEVGRLILDEWGLPLEIGLAVQYHHFPHLGGGTLAYGVALADVVAHAVLDAEGVERLASSDRALESASELGLSQAETAALVDEVAAIWAERQTPDAGQAPES